MQAGKDEKLNFHAIEWNRKYNNCIALFMLHLLLDQPYMRASTVHELAALSEDRAGQSRRCDG